MLQRTKNVARFVLVGQVDYGNLASISKDELERWVSEGVIEWWGFSNDMPSILSKSYLVVLPSYREGFPKILMEASISIFGNPSL